MQNYKEMLRKVFEEGINQGNDSVINELIAPTYVNHSMPAPEPGSSGFRQVVGMFKAGFPDMQVTVEDIIEEGAKVVSRGFFTGTHQGNFMGIPATGKSIHVNYIDIWSVANNQFVDNWVQMDIAGLMQQLGVTPPQS